MTSQSRQIVYRSAGQSHGPIIRLINPSDIGQLVKPFVFLDLFEITTAQRRGFVPHPHSGIATLTVFLEGSMTYRDTTGKSGSLASGAVEWMRAGSGVWHGGEPAPGQPARGFQLWVALPPELELSPAESLYLDADRIAQVGPARVILGSYHGTSSPIAYPVALTYLYVRLKDGETWTYEPSADHNVAWLATNAGKVHTAGTVLEREVAVFAQGNEAIKLLAEGDTELVIASAAKHPYALVTGSSSVHTSRENLLVGERTIADLQRSAQFAALSVR
ncbi:pirin family protein [Rhizobium sp. NZLR1]|uniref:pirin family protein n=1 Tax=Rhizobium sp. NZLR1 TaxID=2731096 RepID=UPI001A991F41|nr:pirin family protein [Rhizobium sp. NZLR1]MBX5204053.1 pirin family protein [Rhizobium sp. NZLR1]QSZ25149.1 pirin family protein [Rhizobium sp. NZLR1]